MSLFQLISFVLILVTGVIFLVATWRWMRAHESVAQSLREIAEAQKTQLAARQISSREADNP